ncbi:PEP-CTERM sorting domain-containing protein [Phragmitibacter flavus]|nr:PEP-CTERM sorting domain-containing protein [Phragmitibacter flavus]
MGVLPTGWYHNDTTGLSLNKTNAGYGMMHAGDPVGYAMTPHYPQGINGTSTLVDANASFDLANGFQMIMGWSPNPAGYLIDNGSFADNEIFQMGLVNYNKALMGIDPSLFLSGIESSASSATNVTNSLLAVRSEGGVLGYFNNGNTVAFAANNYYVFTLDINYSGVGDPSLVDVGLKMDIFNELVPGSATYTFAGSTDFGVIEKLVNPLALDDTLYPGMGLTLRDASMVSISGANFDTITTIVPEPGSMVLVLLSGFIATGVRRRK